MYFNLGWEDYFAMVLMLSAWVLGFFAITRKGKLLHFILAFFERTIPIKVECDPQGNKRYDEQLLQAFAVDAPQNWQDLIGSASSEELFHRIIRTFLISSKLTATDTFETIVQNLKSGTTNKYLCEGKKAVFVDLIKDPIVVCITCMPSLHGLLLYTTMCLYKHWTWNPIEWVLIAVPVAFTGTFFWRLLTLIDKQIEKLK
jgi:hypothetical protein